jgi:hypothetical protein
MVYDAYDLRQAPKNDARGRRLRGDLPALERLIEGNHLMDFQTRANPPSHSRRNLLLAVGAGAGVAGLGLASWRNAHHTTPVAEPFPGFWAQKWTAIDGKLLLMSDFRGRKVTN